MAAHLLNISTIPHSIGLRVTGIKRTVMQTLNWRTNSLYLKLSGPSEYCYCTYLKTLSYNTCTK